MSSDGDGSLATQVLNDAVAPEDIPHFLVCVGWMLLGYMIATLAPLTNCSEHARNLRLVVHLLEDNGNCHIDNEELQQLSEVIMEDKVKQGHPIEEQAEDERHRGRHMQCLWLPVILICSAIFTAVLIFLHGLNYMTAFVIPFCLALIAFSCHSKSVTCYRAAALLDDISSKHGKHAERHFLMDMFASHPQSPRDIHTSPGFETDDSTIAEEPASHANCCTSILAVFSYVYMFYILVLMTPGFMINMGQLYPRLKRYFPYSIDYNPSRVDSLVLKICLDVLLAGFFVIPHSIFARPAVKRRFQCGAAYRPLYTLMSTVQLHALIYYWQPLDRDPLNIVFWDTTLSTENRLYYPLLAMYFLGYLWLVSSTFAIDHFELFGIKQGLGIDLYAALGINSTDAVVRRFHYKVVRHPIMLGFFIMFIFVPSMTFTHLFFSVACIIYCLVAVTFLEEPDLRAAIGRPYEDYANEVPAFCPFCPICKHTVSIY